MFAVCEELNERIILTADTVNKLELLQQYNVVYVPEAVIAMTRTVVDDVDDQSDLSEDDFIPLDGSSNSVVSTIRDNSHYQTIIPSSVDQPIIDMNMRSADYITLCNEQLTDPALTKY